MMSIKQQKDIRKFLEGEYPFDTAEQIYKKAGRFSYGYARNREKRE